MGDIKELTSFSVGGNIYELEKGCYLTMYNEDDKGNESDTVSIHLNQKQIKDMIDMLGHYLIKE